MRIAARSPAELDQIRGPSLWLPATLSLFGALLAWAMAWAGERSPWPLSIITSFQAALILAGAAVLAGSHEAVRGCWQRRVAPSAALRRVRRVFVTRLAQLAACALAGPLLMVSGLAWSRPGWHALGLAAAVLVLLVVSLLVGASLGSRLQPRVGAWLAAGRRLQSSAGWRWLDGGARWQPVPTQERVNFAPPGHTLWICVVLVPQALMQAPRWSFHAWGNAITTGWDLACASLWMLLLGLVINMVIIGPTLHWRSRLAPGGLSAAGWARRMVLGSMLNAMAWMSVALVLSMLVSEPDLRVVQLKAWGPVVADVLLAVSWALWMRGRGNNGLRQVLAGLSLGAATALLLGAARALGFAPQRSLAWLATELGLALIFAVAAQRAWARQDLNRLVPRA